jgi:hypothetical protein
LGNQPAAHRADVDDAPAARVAHAGQDQLGEAGGAEDVGFELASDPVDVDLFDGAERAVPGVVDEHVHLTLLGFDDLDGGPHGRLVGDVEREHPATGSGQVGDRVDVARAGVARSGPAGRPGAGRRRGRCRWRFQ